MTVFSDNILFYTFYCVTRDESQDAAAQELYNRNWRYHKELGLWVTKEQTESFKPPSSPHDIEQGFFIFFDPTTWQKVKKGWTIVWDAMEIKRSSPSSFSSPTSTSTL
jgi:CCR4-NOT transcriptional regulation complex NOT5 subunit